MILVFPSTHFCVKSGKHGYYGTPSFLFSGIVYLLTAKRICKADLIVAKEFRGDCFYTSEIV